MKNRVIAITFSDLHINIWNKFNKDNKRTQDQFRVLSVIRGVCKAYGVPAIFCGDMFHKPENMDNDLHEMIIDEFIKLCGGEWICYAISGNHCMSKSNTINKPSPSWVKQFSKIFPWLSCIDGRSVNINNIFTDITIHGIPYLDHNIGLSEYIKGIKLSKGKNILVLHTDYPGAKDTDGRQIDSVENLNINMFKNFDLVLCGHIHKPQRLSKKVYMVGAPLHQRRTDRDCELGYWEIYSDMKMKFIPLSDFPKFIDVDSEDEILDDGNYYTVIPKKLVTPCKQDNKIHKNLSKVKLARQYIREKGIKDKDKCKLLKNILKESEND